MAIPRDRHGIIRKGARAADPAGSRGDIDDDANGIGSGWPGRFGELGTRLQIPTCRAGADGGVRMSVRISISWPAGRLEAELFDTPSVQALLDALPTTIGADRSGDELVLPLASTMRLDETATQAVEPGTVCYWVEGASLVLQSGFAPQSRGYECCLLTAVNVLGRIAGDHHLLSSVRNGDLVTVERLA
ncbi:MAG: hypothetical protein KDH16_10280 [Rhodocyclaceae bacterium]|nr:hypothetical protein [Rhodocyclaceae bacterium]MCP5308365.1 hypothetical protein [Zoogloeaceae bacterium]